MVTAIGPRVVCFCERMYPLLPSRSAESLPSAATDQVVLGFTCTPRVMESLRGKVEVLGL